MKPPFYLYNSLHRTKEVFKPLSTDKVSLYTCGPTVYSNAHIGNLRAYVFNDILRRALTQYGYTVEHAMNITDVGHLVGDGDEGEDKIERAAAEAGTHPLEVAKRFEAKFFEDTETLNCLRPQTVVRATEAIDDQIALIKVLEDKGFTYQTDTAIYFDTTKLSDYGKLTGQKLEDKMTGAREEVVVATDKRHPADFALWFFLTGRYEHHILHWPSPWGEGFPGWHIECSAISRKVLGQPFDIHTGGVDHIGTHHTNEIAQSEAAYGMPLARFWLHNEHLLIAGHKISKSLGNVVLLDDIRNKRIHPLAFRYLLLTAHYRSKQNFTWDALEGAARTLEGIHRLLREEGNSGIDAALKQKIDTAFFDDLDTPTALSLLHEAKSAQLWREYDEILGLGLGDIKPGMIEIPSEIQRLLNERESARQAKDWAKSDELRHQIERLGYRILDTSDGTKIEQSN